MTKLMLWGWGEDGKSIAVSVSEDSGDGRQLQTTAEKNIHLF
jgi:hypothetical protein